MPEEFTILSNTQILAIRTAEKVTQIIDMIYASLGNCVWFDLTSRWALLSVSP